MDDNKNSTRSRLKYRYDFQDTHRQNDANEAHHTINKSQTSEAKKKITQMMMQNQGSRLSQTFILVSMGM